MKRIILIFSFISTILCIGVLPSNAQDRMNSAWLNTVYNDSDNDIFVDSLPILVKKHQNERFDLKLPSNGIITINKDNGERLYSIVDQSIKPFILTSITWKSGRPDQIVQCYSVTSSNVMGNIGFNLRYKNNNYLQFEGFDEGTTATLIAPRDERCQENLQHLLENPK